MRINHLDLIRYGRFKDTKIIFPKPPENTPDVTVVFGPNEAGKSMTFNALLELLFGFKAGSHPYDFLFERNDLLVGAELEIPGRGATILCRNSKRTQSLLDAGMLPVDETILSSALHGMTKETYQERFSLDEKGLREGGERIANAQGDLGQLLHAGISGLTGMAETLNLLSERSDKFHKKSGRSTILKNGKARLKEIFNELRAVNLTPDREKVLRRNQNRTKIAFDEADAELGLVRKRQAAYIAAQEWQDLSVQMEALEKSLEDFFDGPELPSNASEDVAGLIEKIAAEERRIADSEKIIEEQDQIIKDNPVAALAEKLAAELEKLDQLSFDEAPLIGRAITAQVDMDNRIAEQQGFTTKINGILESLQIPSTDLSTVVLSDAALENLNDAMQDWQDAQNLKKTAQAQVKLTRDSHGSAPTQPKDLTILHSAYRKWSKVAEVSTFQTDHDNARARLTSVVAGLPDTWKYLINAGIPAPETLIEVAQNWAESTSKLEAAVEAVNTSDGELAAARAEVLAQEATPETVNVTTTEETRRNRDLSWQKHRDDISKQTADKFEEAMYADDSSRANYLSGAEARQVLTSARSQQKNAELKHESALKHQNALNSKHTELSKRCSSFAISLGMASDTEPAAFIARQQKLIAAAEADASYLNAERSLESARVQQTNANTALVEAVNILGLEIEQGELSAQVYRVLTLEGSDRVAWEKWVEDEKLLTELIKKAEQYKIDCDDKQNRLDQLTATLPLANRTAENVSAVLPHLRNLGQAYSAYKEISARIEAMKGAVASLNESALCLARIMSIPENEALAEPIQIINNARSSVSASMKADEKRIEAINDSSKAKKSKDDAEQKLQAAQGDLNRIFDGQGGQDIEPRARVAKLTKRDSLRKDLRDAGDNQKQVRNGIDDILFTEELDDLPNATRAVELEQLLKDTQVIRDGARDLQREADRLYSEAFEATDRSDLVTEQATLREEFSSQARQAIVARIGVLAARGALKQLSAEKRSGMLNDVENAFVSMTAPAWEGVDVWSQAEGDKLVGIQSGGNPVPVEQMSTGTMGQLYFALRLAGYNSFARDPGPLPMVLDDIMETFDDTRARAALKLCAEIGENGQAILFTHHTHLVDLARDTIPGVAVVDMPE